METRSTGASGCLCMIPWGPWWASGAGPREHPTALNAGGAEGRDVAQMWSEGEPGWEPDYGGAVSRIGLPATKAWSSVSLVSSSRRCQGRPPQCPKALPSSCSASMPSPLWGVTREKGGAGGCLGREAGRRQSVTVTCSCALLSTC